MGSHNSTKKKEKGGGAGNRRKSSVEVNINPNENVVCSKHFRSESCKAKRCKYSHQFDKSLSHIKNVWEKVDLENMKREDILTDPFCKYIDLYANTPPDPNS